jgi:DNA-binding FadR family transcriptional regulator
MTSGRPSSKSALDLASSSRPLTSPQLYELIAERLLGWIREGTLSVGDRLPSERELAIRLGVSRSSVREAIGALQVEGVVHTKPGAGSFVAAAPSELAIAGSSSAPRPDASPFAVLDAREMLEPAVARAAAERPQTDERIVELLDQMEHARDGQDPEARLRWSEADRLFHRQIAVMTGNPVLVSIAGYLAELMDQPLWRLLRDDEIAVPGRTVSHVAEHRLIHQCIVEGDGDAAAFQARYHVRRVRRLMGD